MTESLSPRLLSEPELRRDGVHTVAEAARYFDRICDEKIDPVVLTASGRPFIAALGRCCLRYREQLLERSAADFAHLQVWADRVNWSSLLRLAGPTSLARRISPTSYKQAPSS